MRKHRRLWDAYRFPGFRPVPTVVGIFGDPKARVIRLQRRGKKRCADAWYRVDLLLFHRRLRCLFIIDLKLTEFTHADAGQMHLYLNYAREHWTLRGENPPVGLILCARKDAVVAHYALEGLPNKVVAAEYRTTLPDERTLGEELTRTRRLLEARRSEVVAKPTLKPRKKWQGAA